MPLSGHCLLSSGADIRARGDSHTLLTNSGRSNHKAGLAATLSPQEPPDAQRNDIAEIRLKLADLTGWLIERYERLVRIVGIKRESFYLGALVTAFTVFSHLDSFINFSRFTSALVQAWRSVIAFPWRWLDWIFGIRVDDFVAGALTVTIALILIIRSASADSNEYLQARTRVFGVAFGITVGMLYTVLIVVPALWASASILDAGPGFLVGALADLFYHDHFAHHLRDIEIPNRSIVAPVVLSVIAFVYLLALTWNYKSPISQKAARRQVTGGVLLTLFVVQAINSIAFDYSAANMLPNRGTVWEIVGTVETVINALIACFALYIASVYLTDPLKMLKRNFQILLIIASLLALDALARLIELFGSVLQS